MPAYFIFFVDINIDEVTLIKLLWAGNYPHFSNGEQAEEFRLFFQGHSSVWGVQFEIPDTVLSLPYAQK